MKLYKKADPQAGKNIPPVQVVGTWQQMYNTFNQSYKFGNALKVDQLFGPLTNGTYVSLCKIYDQDVAKSKQDPAKARSYLDRAKSAFALISYFDKNVRGELARANIALPPAFAPQQKIETQQAPAQSVLRGKEDLLASIMELMDDAKDPTTYQKLNTYKNNLQKPNVTQQEVDQIKDFSETLAQQIQQAPQQTAQANYAYKVIKLANKLAIKYG